MEPVNDLTAEYVRSILRYEPETGSFYWKYRDGAHPRWNGRFPGTRITNKFPNGRVKIGINYKSYLGSRIAWLYVTGSWPARLVDHRNLDKSDTRWTNLREAGVSLNGANQALSRRSTTGLKGVSWHKHKLAFRGSITVNNRHIHLGFYDCPAAAHLAYIIAAYKHFGEFARAA